MKDSKSAVKKKACWFNQRLWTSYKNQPRFWAL